MSLSETSILYFLSPLPTKVFSFHCLISALFPVGRPRLLLPGCIQWKMFKTTSFFHPLGMAVSSRWINFQFFSLLIPWTPFLPYFLRFYSISPAILQGAFHVVHISTSIFRILSFFSSDTFLRHTNAFMYANGKRENIANRNMKIIVF